MKYKKCGQSILAGAVSVGMGLGLTSCAGSNTIDYLYLLSSRNNPGQINVYRVDSETGGLLQIPNSPYPAGRNPVGLTIAPNGKVLYVINHDDNTVESFGIGTDAKLYPQHTYTTPGSEPVAIGINAAGTFLFVVDFYQPVFTDQNPGPGAVIVYPIQSDGSLGTSGLPGNGVPAPQTLANGQAVSYYPLDTAPAAVNVLANGSTVYVTETLSAAGTALCNGTSGGLVALTIGSTGVLTPTTGSPYCAGITPSALTGNPASSFVYVTDSAQNELLSYAVAGDGSLTTSGSVPTGTFPDSVTIEPRGLYMYVANRTAGNIQSFTLAAQTGVPSQTGSYSTGPYPQCVIVEPSEAQFVYTADFQGSGSTGYKLDPSTGNLTATENSPYPGTGLSTCLAATPHGKHTVAK